MAKFLKQTKTTSKIEIAVTKKVYPHDAPEARAALQALADTLTVNELKLLEQAVKKPLLKALAFTELRRRI